MGYRKTIYICSYFSFSNKHTVTISTFLQLFTINLAGTFPHCKHVNSSSRNLLYGFTHLILYFIYMKMFTWYCIFIKILIGLGYKNVKLIRNGDNVRNDNGRSWSISAISKSRVSNRSWITTPPYFRKFHPPPKMYLCI